MNSEEVTDARVTNEGAGPAPAPSIAARLAALPGWKLRAGLLTKAGRVVVAPFRPRNDRKGCGLITNEGGQADACDGYILCPNCDDDGSFPADILHPVLEDDGTAGVLLVQLFDVRPDAVVGVHEANFLVSLDGVATGGVAATVLGEAIAMVLLGEVANG